MSAVQTPAQSPRTEEGLDQGRGCSGKTKASEVVLVGWLINDMKTDLTQSEFKRMVKALAAHFEDQKANPRAQLNRTVLPRGWARGSSQPPPD